MELFTLQHRFTSTCMSWIWLISHNIVPKSFTYSKDPHEIYDPAVIGTQSILEAAHKYGPSITRVVILSSFISVLNAQKGQWPGHTYTEADWNPVSFLRCNFHKLV